MTLMSMSMILLAIVQDMPKFSMSERKGRGSFSGIPLIGLYYFMLLVIVSFSTVTTSMFVYMERNVRIHNRIPFYLRWLITFEKKKKQLSFRGISTKRRRAHAFENEATQIHSTITPPTHGHLNGFVGSGIVSSQQQLLTDDRQSLLNVHHRLSGSISNSNATTQNVALSLLRLISCDRDSGSCQDKALTGRKKVTVEAPDENCQPDKKLKKRKDEQLNSTEGIKLRKSNSPIPPPPPSPAAAALSQRKRHSLLHAESPLVG
uniref:Neurotransmitter-gated ion-channel transmembrane domain-containing protein n=1 Tax=Meloidogyne incognita TaxID=6306 RepID=A0A914KR82_MELIC